MAKKLKTLDVESGNRIEIKANDCDKLILKNNEISCDKLTKEGNDLVGYFDDDATIIVVKNYFKDPKKSKCQYFENTAGDELFCTGSLYTALSKNNVELEFDYSEETEGKKIYGTSYSDGISGTAHDDEIWTYGGENYVQAGDGDDIIHGGNNGDTLVGGKGNDIIYTGKGNDRIETGDGDDIVNINGSGTKTIKWESGNDTINGITKATKVNLKISTDIEDLNFTKQGNNLIVTRTEAGSEGTLTVKDAFKAANKINLNDIDFNEDTFIKDISLKNYLKNENIDYKYANIKKKETFKGNNANNTFTGSNMNDTIYTGAGNDEVYAGLGKDTIKVNGIGKKTIHIEDKDKDTIEVADNAKNINPVKSAEVELDYKGINVADKTEANQIFSFKRDGSNLEIVTKSGSINLEPDATLNVSESELYAINNGAGISFSSTSGTYNQQIKDTGLYSYNKDGETAYAVAELETNALKNVYVATIMNDNKNQIGILTSDYDSYGNYWKNSLSDNDTVYSYKVDYLNCNWLGDKTLVRQERVEYSIGNTKLTSYNDLYLKPNYISATMGDFYYYEVASASDAGVIKASEFDNLYLYAIYTGKMDQAGVGFTTEKVDDHFFAKYYETISADNYATTFYADKFHATVTALDSYNVGESYYLDRIPSGMSSVAKTYSGDALHNDVTEYTAVNTLNVYVTDSGILYTTDYLKSETPNMSTTLKNYFKDPNLAANVTIGGVKLIDILNASDLATLDRRFKLDKKGNVVYKKGVAVEADKQTINGTFLSEKIIGGSGKDTILTGAGTDKITAGKGDDTIKFGEGDKTIIIKSGDGNDTLSNYNKADKITLDLQGYDSRVYNRVNNDLVISSTDNDGKALTAIKTLYVTKAGELTTTSKGTSKVSTNLYVSDDGKTYSAIEKEGYTTKVDLTTTKFYKHADGTINTISTDPLTEKLTISGYYNNIEVDKIYLGDTLLSTILNDVVVQYGNAKGADYTKAQKFNGSLYNEKFVGGKAADTIYTGAGVDTVIANAGNDKIYINGVGKKTIDAGAGNDTVYVKTDVSTDTTIAFGNGSDTLDVTKGIDVNNLALTDAVTKDSVFSKSGKNLVITNAKNNTVTINNYFDANYNTNLEQIKIGESTLGEVVSSNIVNISGNTKTIDGTKYNDYVVAGAKVTTTNLGDGNDTLYANFQKMTVNGGDGYDTVIMAKSSVDKFLLSSAKKEITNNGNGGKDITSDFSTIKVDEYNPKTKKVSSGVTMNDIESFKMEGKFCGTVYQDNEGNIYYNKQKNISCTEFKYDAEKNGYFNKNEEQLEISQDHIWYESDGKPSTESKLYYFGNDEGYDSIYNAPNGLLTCLMEDEIEGTSNNDTFNVKNFDFDYNKLVISANGGSDTLNLSGISFDNHLNTDDATADNLSVIFDVILQEDENGVIGDNDGNKYSYTIGNAISVIRKDCVDEKAGIIISGGVDKVTLGDNTLYEYNKTSVSDEIAASVANWLANYTDCGSAAEFLTNNDDCLRSLQEFYTGTDPNAGQGI